MQSKLKYTGGRGGQSRLGKGRRTSGGEGET